MSIDILAIDGSTKSTGFAIFSDQKLMKAWHKTAASSDLIKRIQVMRDELRTTLADKTYNISTIVMEEVRPDRGFTNPTTMKALMWLQAAFVMMIHDEFPGIKIIYTYPSEWRAACGIKTGRGIKRDELKEADIEFVNTHYCKVTNDDEADAICIGHAHVMKSGFHWD